MGAWTLNELLPHPRVFLGFGSLATMLRSRATPAMTAPSHPARFAAG